jgi:flavin reductase (DIM6/NTAB) family NADH-FMN oxidoreductase RutF
LTPDPPTILVSIDNKTIALAGVRSSGHFAVNYLPGTALAVADAFTSKSDAEPIASPLASGKPW